MRELGIMPVRHDWNRVGPPVPLWFRKTLKRIDPTLELQYIPATDVDPAGMDVERFPFGGWQICRRLKRTGWLHKLSVYSLMDRFGRFAPPGAELVKILRLARNLWNHGHFTRMEQEMERSIDVMRRAAAQKSHAILVEAIDKFLSYQGHRQFKNRVFNAGSLIPCQSTSKPSSDHS